MKGAKAWAAYTAAIVGAQVEDFEQKFSGLSEDEQKAWAAAEGAAVPAVPSAPAPLKL